MVSKFLAVFVLFGLIACNSGGNSNGTSSSPQTNSKNEAPPNPGNGKKGDEPSKSGDTSVGAPTANTSTSCPWNISDDPVAKKYKDLGVEITLDCTMAENYFQMNRSDINGPLKVLDQSSDLFEGWANKPTTIRIGGGPFHNSKDKIIQLPVRMGGRDEDLKNYLENVKTLIDFEVSQFNSEVRVSYIEYHLAKKKDGTILDVGAGILYPFDKEFLKSDLEILKKYKTQILAHKKQYPNVVLYHGNEFGLFRINNWEMSYTFASGIPANDQIAYFNYLTKYEALRKAYEPVDIVSTISGYPTTDFKGFNEMLNVAAKIRDVVLNMQPQPKMVQLTREITPSLNFGVSFLLMNNTLKIENIMDSSGQVAKAADVRACLAKADFSKSARFKCGGE